MSGGTGGGAGRAGTTAVVGALVVGVVVSCGRTTISPGQRLGDAGAPVGRDSGAAGAPAVDGCAAALGCRDAGVATADLGTLDEATSDVATPDAASPMADAADTSAAMPPSCPAGAHPAGRACVDDAPGTFSVSVPVTTIPADGATHIPVFVSGRALDGTPSTAETVVSLSRSGVGTFTPSARVQLGATPPSLSFVPCSDAIAGCLGPFKITLALANDPATPVAASPALTLVASTGVGSALPCLGVDHNILFVQGDGLILHGTETNVTDSWRMGSLTAAVTLELIVGRLYDWDIVFSSEQLGTQLREQVYERAQRHPFEDYGRPGMAISGHGFGCNMISGRFQIERLILSGNTVDELTATFEQYCDGSPVPLTGCVHYQGPTP